MTDGKGSSGHRPDDDEIVSKLVKNPSEVPDLRILTGFLGQSSRTSCRRLYLTAELDEYLEIPAEDILHTRSLVTEDNPLGGTVVWVKRESNIIHTRSASRESQGDFLQGELTAAFLPQARTAALLSLRATGAAGLANSFVCTLNSRCLTSVETDPFCPKLTSPISTSKCACPDFF